RLNLEEPPQPSPGSITQPPPGSIVETGNVLEMRPANGSQIVEQINEKLRLISFWPLPLIAAAIAYAYLSNQPSWQWLAMVSVVLGTGLSAFLAYYDKQRKTVVIMYDLDEDAIAPFRRFAEAFDELRAANRIWNIDTAEYTPYWKRHAGANRLLTRRNATLTDSVPRVIKTNVSIPGFSE